MERSNTSDQDDELAALQWVLILEHEVTPEATEDDKSLLRRLQEEWQAIDAGDVEITQIETSPTGMVPQATVPLDSASHPGRDTQMDPKRSIDEFKGMFVSDLPCSKCQGPMPSRRGFAMHGSASPPSFHFILHASCPNCNVNHCRGCLRPLSCEVDCEGKPGCDVFTCCAKIRAIALFEALGAFDRIHLASKIVDELSVSTQETLQTTGQGSAGYSISSTSGPETASGPRWESRKVNEVSVDVDTILARALQTINLLLPNPNSERVYDIHPHPSIRPLLQLSFLPDVLRELLRNGSIHEWTLRRDLYHETLQTLGRLADSELLMKILMSEGLEKESSPGIAEFLWGTADIKWTTGHADPSSASDSASGLTRSRLSEGVDKQTSVGVEEDVSKTPPLYEYFKKPALQCEAFLTLASQENPFGQLPLQSDENAAKEETTLKMICLDILRTRNGILRALLAQTRHQIQDATPSQIGEDKGKAADRIVSMEEIYRNNCERLGFAHADLSLNGTGLDYGNHLYGPILSATAFATRDPKKRLHLLKELSVLATSLPPGIWVRIDETRNDAINVLIAGPEGTPYSGGLFEFHCFIPLEYPTECPKISLRTTANGRVRFNPDLHSDGKVCLSLLGTWTDRPEESWSPNKSTLLQVLVSIQSMIFVEAPMYNELGYARKLFKDSMNIVYNKNVSLQTVRWAMLYWMRDKFKNHVWSDVIASHFCTRKQIIRDQIVKWSTEDSRIRAYSKSTTRLCGAHTPFLTFGIGNVNAPKCDLLAEFDKRVSEVKLWRSVKEC